MLELKNPRIAVPVVLFAGILWSFGPLVVRYMDNPNLVPWQYIFGRGLTIFIILNLYLYFEEGMDFWKNYLKIGKSGVVGGSGLGIAMISFIYSITNTSAAITLLCLAAMPFFTALLAFLFLKEKITISVWVSIAIATIGIAIMAFGNSGENSFVGFVFGITSSIGFSVFSVSLRWRKETPKFTTVAFAGFFCFVFATIMILSKDQVFFSTSYNSSLFSLHGTLVCLGLILYSIGSKAIPAAELTLLSLTEVIGGIFWVWLPLFGINEVPDTNTIIGGFFLFISLFYYSLIMRWNKRYIGLN
ncbi:DMT family transporter [Candidatus Pelagibacter sp.]|jgi:drug/metabolite transporter (DMT)-like permease|nr:DMT family transporter [Candidatus Pelagibacter sp.]MDC0597696.1 DMT family transporter [Candidatus Pelagibacter sp.]MDC0974846.1 DMT family transporter [Candidatus Pelagibacter sp.]MDC1133185.1 DMT family transporter [Candidatus Pelagibacter sp.]MDC1134604.1 DMT family transporter [Candidatus Pelagibacter sp.]